ncbi:hypothetical protein J6590_048651 [Homalodisca vitripennis]|nr:hypothetical protein J6590_048651 [Homalodisca vitripennis]
MVQDQSYGYQAPDWLCIPCLEWAEVEVAGGCWNWTMGSEDVEQRSLTFPGAAEYLALNADAAESPGLTLPSAGSCYFSQLPPHRATHIK